MDDAARLEATVEEFCRWIGGLPACVLVEQEWGPKEVLAHLVYHHELYVAQAEAFLAGTPQSLPRGRYADLNRSAVAASRGVAPADLVDRLREANRRLVAIHRQCDPHAVMLGIKVGSRPWSLARIVPAAESHIRSHLKQLRRECRSTP